MSPNVTTTPSAPPPFSAFVSFPSPLLTGLITRSLLRTFPHLPILSSLPSPPPLPLLQWADYDRIDHSLTLHLPSAVLSSSYVIRKALIRKHFLASAIEQYVAKHPESRLVQAAPRTWAVELRWADEMEEMWVDELWDLARDMEERASEGEGGGWWILKPGMADKGQGIRVFGSREELEDIMAEFEDDDSGEDEGDGEEADGEGTRVSTQQMRHFVIQEYIHPPLLISPHPGPFIPHKFHIRAYTLSLSSSPLSLYLHPRLLCLFASSPYSPPTPSMSRASLSRHLTNTCLIEASSGETEEWVFELDELVGKAYDSPGGVRVLTREDVEEVRMDVGEVLAETWRAAIGAGQVHFQPLPNAFELFGADLLLSLSPTSLASLSPASPKFRTHILELNASPDIDQTGSRLASVIEELVDGIVEVGVEGWARGMGWSGEQKGRGGGGGGEGEGMRKVLEVGVRG